MTAKPHPGLARRHSRPAATATKKAGPHGTGLVRAIVAALSGFAQSREAGLVAQAAHRRLLELTCALTADAELAARRLDRALAPVAQAEAQLDHAPLVAAEAIQRACDRALHLVGLDLLGGRRLIA